MATKALLPSKSSPSLIPEVQYKPLSKTLQMLQKTDCLFCDSKATKAANLELAEVRCCNKKQCRDLAKQFAEQIYSSLHGA